MVTLGLLFCLALTREGNLSGTLDCVCTDMLELVLRWHHVCALWMSSVKVDSVECTLSCADTTSDTLILINYRSTTLKATTSLSLNLLLCESKAKVIKWFRGEYTTKTEAKQDLGVNIIITDDDWYEYIKIFAAFLRKAGYSGLYILIDELVNLYKITNSITRQNNYEKMLAMYNDAMQGKAQYMGIIMCGTPECMEDKRRGIFSYEALRSRLGSGRFSGDHADLLAPVIRLKALSYEEMLVLTEKLSALHADLYNYDQKLTDDDLVYFLKAEYERIGASQLITPREVIRDFIELLDILYQEPGTQLMELLSSGGFRFGDSLAVTDSADTVSEEYAEFTI